MPRSYARLSARYLLLTALVVLLNFLIPRLLPGDPFTLGGSEGLDAGTALPAAVKEQLRAYYHLDQPLISQLGLYVADLARGDLGWSIASNAPVGQLIMDRLPWTLALFAIALLFSAVAGTALGMIAGWSAGRLRDRVLVLLTALLAAVPEFLIASGLLLFFAVLLGWFPLLGGRTLFSDYGAGVAGWLRALLDIAWHLTLPAAALAASGTAGFVLIARDLAAGARDAQWVVAARARGLAERRIAVRHVLPNIALPLLTFFGLRLGAILGGALVVERVFNLPGLGLLAYQAIGSRDYPVLQALFLLASLAVLAANYLIELQYLRLARRRGPARA